MEWVASILQDLKQSQSEDYAQHLIKCIESWLEKGKSKLDPKEFRNLYIKKIAQEQNN
jgi:hypothetical protein